MKALPVLVTLLAGAVSVSADAAVFCTGNINRVGVDPGGVVTMYSPAVAPDFVYVCQIGGTTNGVSSDACKSIYATLLAAKAQGVAVQWAFNDSTTCGQRAAWTYLSNWYWGPIVWHQ